MLNGKCEILNEGTPYYLNSVCIKINITNFAAIFNSTTDVD
jgi:hypothetical protein